MDFFGVTRRCPDIYNVSCYLFKCLSDIFNRSNNSESSFYRNSPSLSSRNAFWNIQIKQLGHDRMMGFPTPTLLLDQNFLHQRHKMLPNIKFVCFKDLSRFSETCMRSHKTNNRSGMNPGDLMVPSSLPWGAYWFIAKKWMVVMVHPFEESSSTFYRSNSDLKYLVLWRKKESSELRRAENSGKLNIWGIADKKRRVSHERFTKILYHKGVFFYIYLFSYNKLNYICIFICSYLWSIGGQMHINDISINNV